MSDFMSIDSRIQKYSNPEELIQATFIQLEKDARMVGLPIDFIDKVDLQQKIDHVQHWIRRVINEEPNALSSLFYRIDLDQNLATSILSESSDYQGVVRLVRLVLKREFSKVILRRELSL